MKSFLKYFLISLIFVSLLFGLFAFLFGSSKSPFYVPPVEETVSNYSKVCNENWFCTGWGPCIGNFNKRNCVDLNKCGTLKKQPDFLKTCVSQGTVYYYPNGSVQNKPSNISNTLNTNDKPLQDCSKAILPNCGYAYPDLVSLTTVNIEGDDVEILNFNEDCSLTCLGKSFLTDCSFGKVYLEGIDGSSQLLEIKGIEKKMVEEVEKDFCNVRLEILESIPEQPELKGQDLVCPIPFENMALVLDFIAGYDVKESDYGISTMIVLDAMFYSAFNEEDSPCTGSMMELV